MSEPLNHPFAWHRCPVGIIEPKTGVLHRQFVISLAVIVVSQALFVLAVLWMAGAL